MPRRVFALALVFAAVSGVSLAQATLKIKFTGMVSFVERPGGLVDVILPAPDTAYGSKKNLPEHRPFIRFEDGSVLQIAKDDDPLTRKTLDLSVDGLTPGPITSNFKDVYLMSKKISDEQLKRAIRFQLPAGGDLHTEQLAQDALGANTQWKYYTRNETADYSSPGDPAASIMAFSLSVPEAPVIVRIGGATVSVPFNNHVAAITLGSLRPSDYFYNGGTKPVCVDWHFILHYRLEGAVSANEHPNDVKMPFWIDSSCPGSLRAEMRKSGKGAMTGHPEAKPGTTTHGPRDDCFMAHWKQ